MDKEELTKKIKVISQEAWTVETNTTVNAICEYIIRETIFRIVGPLLDEIYTELEHVDRLNAKVLALEIKNLDEVIKNASKDGGISEPKRNSEASIKGSRKSTKAGGIDGGNAGS